MSIYNRDGDSMKWFERCRALREDREPKTTQSQLGEIFKMGQRKISRLENGEIQITPDEIGQYCRFFDVSADYLLGFTDDITPFPKRKK